ncbi:uncharacterized protein NECHADRAFT_87485 [Fusarium vanettenii 77-13-4]|uniref:Uncharacterized protein n=1 Tax=Fusarium vanettenii (strain ATCC MYA-4622 / CBS 123669 / FGSC 9596 / NRRL 45880 / 77-13-4) TaxID=660122 RepID=C7ZEG4_FUSV7|nr:uncharacterized protein NECHADRAFT_87485 [Fusarium vanettenii 77-13-4]EEU37591.1 hypothetical protein NECHADRAFT_87485 [Fusarium vanettenii 77-13-4]
MHLDHKIPWKTAASHFNLVPSNTEGRFDVVALDLPSQASTLGHFSRVVSATIKEFSETELTKVPSAPSSAKLFSDDVLVFPERHFGLGPHDTNSALHNPLSTSHQDVKYWQRRAEGGDFCTSDGDLADAVKMLVVIAAVAPKKPLRIEALAALLRLASETPLSQLRSLSWGHAFGANLVASVALQAYVLLNLTEAVQCRQKEHISLLKIDPLMGVLNRDALQDYDYPAQNIPHRAFWSSIGVLDLSRGAGGDECVVVDPLAQENDEIHQEARSGLRQYLKDCFAILYVYDVVLRQACGSNEAEEFWAYEMGGVFWRLGCKMKDN